MVAWTHGHLYERLYIQMLKRHYYWRTSRRWESSTGWSAMKVSLKYRSAEVLLCPLPVIHLDNFMLCPDKVIVMSKRHCTTPKSRHSDEFLFCFVCFFFFFRIHAYQLLLRSRDCLSCEETTLIACLYHSAFGVIFPHFGMIFTRFESDFH